MNERNHSLSFQKIISIWFISCLLLSLIFIRFSPAQSLPQARVETVKDTFHGIEVPDPYRWLENWDNPAVQDWSNQQNAYARNYLDNLSGVDAIRRDVTEIMSNASISYKGLKYAGGKIFAIKYQPPLNQPLMVTLESADSPETEHVILNLNDFDKSGETSIDWYEPSPDGSIVGVSLSKGGSEKGDLYLFDVKSGKSVDVIIEHVNNGTAGGDMVWLADGSGFYYTRYPRHGERPDEDLEFYLQVWFHQLGTQGSYDTYSLGQDFPRIAEIRFETNYKTGGILAHMQYGDSGRLMHFFLEPGREWRQLTSYEDQIAEVHIGPDNNLFFLSQKDAPRGKILRLSADAGSIAEAETIIPEDQNTIASNFWFGIEMAVTDNLIYLQYQLGGPMEIRVFDHDGNAKLKPKILPVSSILGVVPLHGDQILYKNVSYLKPAAWYHFDPETGESNATKLAETSNVDFRGIEVLREFAVSKDGTRIPLNILRPKGIRLDGNNPVLITAYGGYGISRTPVFYAINDVWLGQGGVYVVANIRGGGEFGEAWHRAGMLTKKQNCFDDFAAAMQFMIDTGYTKPEKLAIIGGSNGGLLMGAIITQHPDLFRVAVSRVGVYDMIRVELTPNGAFNIPEYGTVKDPDQFRALLAYSPYHNVQDGVKYPSLMFMTGANDPRVDPMHSRKFTARLQAATTSDSPIILRTSATTGHGGGTPLATLIEEYVDQYAFLFNELGVEYKTGAMLEN
jgi:prolyl oligopeptidase